MSEKFKRTKENFRCGICDMEIHGNGYTNHCPKCLWSRHVDVYPGDRQSDCGGMMEPIDIFKKDNGFVVEHKCVKCGIVRRNKIDFLADDIDSFINKKAPM